MDRRRFLQMIAASAAAANSLSAPAQQKQSSPPRSGSALGTVIASKVDVTGHSRR